MNTFLTFNQNVNTRKVILVIVAIILFVFVLIGLLGSLIAFIMKKQAKAVDKDMAALTLSRQLTNAKDFKKVANSKSIERFYRQQFIPFFILLLSLILYVIYHLCFPSHPWNENIFNRETGISSLFYLLDFSSIEYYPPLGSNFSSWVWLQPEPFYDERIFNYLIFLTALIGLIYYLVITQAYIARKFYIIKVSKSLYSMPLSEMNLSSIHNKDIVNPLENENQQSNINQ